MFFFPIYIFSALFGIAVFSVHIPRFSAYRRPSSKECNAFVLASWQVVITTHSEIMGWLWSTLLFIHVIVYKGLSYSNVIISAEFIGVI